MFPRTMDTASKVAKELRKRYDLLFLRLETPVPVQLTAVARWAVSASKIPSQAWKAPITTWMIEEYLAENVNTDSESNAELQIQPTDWKLVVDEFISTCDELVQAREQHWSALLPDNDQLPGHSRISSRTSSRASSRTGSRTRSRTSSISEGHVSPDDDGPSKKDLLRFWARR